MAWYLSDSQNVNIDNQLTFLSNPGNNGEVVYNVSGLPTWKKITGISRFIDTTNGVQDMNTGPTPINFNTEDINDANISYGVTQFNINDEGFYTIDFQCLLSNGNAQTAFSMCKWNSGLYSTLNRSRH